VNSLPIACRVRKEDYCFDAYVEAHMGDVQDQRPCAETLSEPLHTSPLPGRPLRGSLEQVESSHDDRPDSCSWS
jgi:hypothetical protein